MNGVPEFDGAVASWPAPPDSGNFVYLPATPAYSVGLVGYVAWMFDMLGDY
jgi:hypothetical protein